MPQLGETVDRGNDHAVLKQVGTPSHWTSRCSRFSRPKVDSRCLRPRPDPDEIIVPRATTVEVGARLAVLGDAAQGSAPAAPAPAPPAPAPEPRRHPAGGPGRACVAPRPLRLRPRHPTPAPAPPVRAGPAPAPARHERAVTSAGRRADRRSAALDPDNDRRDRRGRAHHSRDVVNAVRHPGRLRRPRPPLSRGPAAGSARHPAGRRGLPSTTSVVARRAMVGQGHQRARVHHRSRWTTSGSSASAWRPGRIGSRRGLSLTYLPFIVRAFWRRRLITRA